MLAGPGVITSTALTAAFAIYVFGYDWNWYVGLMFGSMMSATDPVAVVALVKV
jgi:solute carrier family 9 (sodium/hydrogen exchanger), member 10/11